MAFLWNPAFSEICLQACALCKLQKISAPYPHLAKTIDSDWQVP
jgi:hypothetical protein